MRGVLAIALFALIVTVVPAAAVKWWGYLTLFSSCCIGSIVLWRFR